MKARPAAAFLTLVLAGCPGGPQTSEPPDIDLRHARSLESQGKVLEAIAEYARLVRELNDQGRSDARAHAAWGRILGSLHRLQAPKEIAKAPPEFRMRCVSLREWCSLETPGLLATGAAGHWSQALALGAEPALLVEGAGAISDVFAQKAEDPALRRGRIELEGDLPEPLYRRSLAQAAAEYAHYALSRSTTREAPVVERAVARYKRLAYEIRALGEVGGALPVAKDRWAERALAADAQAVAMKRWKPGDTPLSNDLRQVVELDTAGLLKLAVDDVNKANDLLSRRADEGEILEALERALRNFVAGRECLIEPSPIQRRTLDVMSMAGDALRSLAFEK